MEGQRKATDILSMDSYAPRRNLKPVLPKYMAEVLPNKFKETSNDINKFKNKLKEFLYLNSFFTLDEFFKK
jgi:hypothetical protein